MSTGRRGEIFIENKEENIRVTRRYLSQLSMVKIRISLEFLTPQGVTRRMILVQHKLQ